MLQGINRGALQSIVGSKTLQRIFWQWGVAEDSW